MLSVFPAQQRLPVSRRGRRLLHVPLAEDREQQRRIYDRVKHLAPVSWKPEVIQAKIQAVLRSNPQTMALRTDLENCFETLPQNRIAEKIAKLPVPGPVREALFQTVKIVPRGLPIGSPLSPWLAELVLRDIDAVMAGTPHYFRYVDDICVLGSRAECNQAKNRLETIARSLGLALHQRKTVILPGHQLTFLGRSYQDSPASEILTVNLGGEAFELPNDRTLTLRVSRENPAYAESPGQIHYNLDCLLHRLSGQPTPFLLEMLMLRPAATDPVLQQIIANPQCVLDARLPLGLHGKIFRHYLQNVKPHGHAQPARAIGAAGEVFRWLHLSNYIMEHSQLPANYLTVQEEWKQLSESLRAGNYDPYHQSIRKLFKREYELRSQTIAGKTPLPTLKPALALFAAD